MIYFLLQFDDGSIAFFQTERQNISPTYLIELRKKYQSMLQADFCNLLKVDEKLLPVTTVPTGTIAHAVVFERPQVKCKVRNCPNHTDEGHFIGDFCGPCWHFIVNCDNVNNYVVRNALNLCKKQLGL